MTPPPRWITISTWQLYLGVFCFVAVLSLGVVAVVCLIDDYHAPVSVSP